MQNKSIENAIVSNPFHVDKRSVDFADKNIYEI